MKIKTIKETVLREGLVDSLSVSRFYDLDGMIIPEGTEEQMYKQAKFKLVEIVQAFCNDEGKEGTKYTDIKLYIDDNRVESWITEFKYTPHCRRLEIRACSGAG